MLCEERTAQLAAFVLQLNGRGMGHSNLISLLCHANAESLRRFGEPISSDLAMWQQSPLPSSQSAVWKSWISLGADNEMTIRLPAATRESFDLLSDVDLGLLLWAWRHHNNSECPSPDNSLSEEDLFLFLGKSAEIAQIMAEHLREQRLLDDVISKLR